MKTITIYKIDDIPEFENKLCLLMENDYCFSFIRYNPTIKKELLRYKQQANLQGSIALLCKSFSDLVFLFSLSEIAELLEKGVLLIIEDNPTISQIRIDFFDGKEQLVVSKTEQVEIDTIKAIAFSQIRKKHGRASAVLSQEFVRDYWEWQLGNLTVKEILSNSSRNYTFTTKQQFYLLVQRYEQSNSYFMQQEIHALDIIAKKKNGSVNLKAINEYGEDNMFAILDPEAIKELMNILEVNHIDFWRIIKRFYGSRQYIELDNVRFKRSIKKAAELINDYKSFFIRPESTTINYGQDISDIIADIKCTRILFKNRYE